MNNTVTVLIPTYKRPVKLKQAIESVLAQTYTDLKVIVCDNASGDETAEVVNAIMQADSRVEYFQHAENIGMNANFNFAISRVDTPFFTMLTDDDYQLPNYLQDAMRGFEQYPQIACSIVSAPTILESGEMLGDQVANWPKEGLYEPGEAMGELISWRHPILTACIFRIEVQQTIKFEEQFSTMSDIPILAEILSNYPICLSKKVGLYFVRHQNNAGSGDSPIEYVLNVWHSIRETLNQANNIEPTLKRLLQEQLSSQLRYRYLRLLLRAVSKRDSLAISNIYTEVQRAFPAQKNLLAWVIFSLTKSRVTMYCMGWCLRVFFEVRKLC